MDSSMRRRGDWLPTLEWMTPEQLKEYIENTHTEVVAATILSLLKELSDRERENDGLK